jgi:hypothetical protein
MVPDLRHKLPFIDEPRDFPIEDEGWIDLSGT